MKIFSKNKAQYTVEFVLIFPLVLLLVFAVVEFGFYFRAVFIVQDIAEEAATVASREFVDPNMISNDITSTNFNPAAIAAFDVITNRAASLAVSNVVLTYNDLGSTYGARPYALYEFTSTQTRNVNGANVPIISLLVDYRIPDQDGVAIQVIYQYKTFFFGMSFPLPNGQNVTILPRDIAISSTRVQAYANY